MQILSESALRLKKHVHNVPALRFKYILGLYTREGREKNRERFCGSAVLRAIESSGSVARRLGGSVARWLAGSAEASWRKLSGEASWRELPGGSFLFHSVVAEPIPVTRGFRVNARIRNRGVR